MHRLRTEPFLLGDRIEITQYVTPFAGGFRRTGNPEVIAAIVDLHVKAAFDLPQVLVELSTKIGKPLVVRGLQIEFLND